MLKIAISKIASASAYYLNHFHSTVFSYIIDSPIHFPLIQGNLSTSRKAIALLFSKTYEDYCIYIDSSLLLKFNGKHYFISPPINTIVDVDSYLRKIFEGSSMDFRDCPYEKLSKAFDFIDFIKDHPEVNLNEVFSVVPFKSDLARMIISTYIDSYYSFLSYDPSRPSDYLECWEMLYTDFPIPEAQDNLIATILLCEQKKKRKENEHVSH
jgi:hypothetical protein